MSTSAHSHLHDNIYKRIGGRFPFYNIFIDSCNHSRKKRNKNQRSIAKIIKPSPKGQIVKRRGRDYTST